MFTAENYARLEWEISDEPDAPGGASDALVRMLVAHAKELDQKVRTLEAPLPPWANALVNAPEEESDRERIEFIRRAAIAMWADPDVVEPFRVWEYARTLWDAKPEDC